MSNLDQIYGRLRRPRPVYRFNPGSSQLSLVKRTQGQHAYHVANPSNTRFNKGSSAIHRALASGATVCVTPPSKSPVAAFAVVIEHSGRRYCGAGQSAASAFHSAVARLEK